MSMKNKILLGLAVGLLATATTIPAMASGADDDVEFNWGAPASAGQADSTRKLSEAPSLPDDPEGKGDVSDDDVPALEEDELEVAGAAAGILPPAVSRSEIARVVVDQMRPRVKQLQDEHRLELATAATAATARIEALQRQLIDLSSSFSGALKSVTKLAAGFNGALSGVKTVKEAQEKGPLLVSNASIITSKYERMLAAAVQPQGGPDAAELERKAQEEALDQPKGPSAADQAAADQAAADQAAADQAAAGREHQRLVDAARRAREAVEAGALEIPRLQADQAKETAALKAANAEIQAAEEVGEEAPAEVKQAKKAAAARLKALAAEIRTAQTAQDGLVEAAKRASEAASAAPKPPRPPEAKPEAVEDDAAAARAAEQKRLRQQRNAAAAEERRLEDERRRQGNGGSEDDADAKARAEADRKKREQRESEQATKKADKVAADKAEKARKEEARREEARREEARREEARREEARKEEARREEARREEELQNSSTKGKRAYRGGLNEG